jgi:hypothetical protein
VFRADRPPRGLLGRLLQLLRGVQHDQQTLAGFPCDGKVLESIASAPKEKDAEEEEKREIIVAANAEELLWKAAASTGWV